MPIGLRADPVHCVDYSHLKRPVRFFYYPLEIRTMAKNKQIEINRDEWKTISKPSAEKGVIDIGV